MNKEDIIRMAREVGLPHWYETEGVVNEELLIKFANLVASAEREACANSMVEIVKIPTFTHGPLVKLSDVVNAIRTRGQA